MGAGQNSSRAKLFPIYTSPQQDERPWNSRCKPEGTRVFAFTDAMQSPGKPQNRFQVVFSVVAPRLGASMQLTKAFAHTPALSPGFITTHNFGTRALAIPKGLHNSAQGCESRATLGKPFEIGFNPNGVASVLASV